MTDLDTPDPNSNTSPTSDLPVSNTVLTKRQQAELELLRSPHSNNVEIAERIGASDELVRRTRKELEASRKLEPVTTVIKRTAVGVGEPTVNE